MADPLQSSAVQHLRHSYFVKHRGWVTCNGSGEETDHYDPFCQHLAVFHNDHIFAYMRLLPWQPTTGFMLEHDFACLLTNEERSSIIHDHSAELSRLVIAPAALDCDESHTLLVPKGTKTSVALIPSARHSTRNGIESEAQGPAQFAPHVLELLLKLLYHVAIEQGIITFYAVFEPPTLLLLKRKFGIPFKTIGSPYTFPDGTHTVAAFTTLGDIEASIKRRWLHKYEWYQQNP